MRDGLSLLDGEGSVLWREGGSIATGLRRGKEVLSRRGFDMGGKVPKFYLGTAAWLVFAGQADVPFNFIVGTGVVGMAGNQSAEDLVMSRASARFTNFPPCFL